jgi:hypothetical protein
MTEETIDEDLLEKASRMDQWVGDGGVFKNSPRGDLYFFSMNRPQPQIPEP